MTFISIIIPFNKGERYLKDCLDSLSEQKLEDSEIILICNGVNEDLDDLLENYKNLLNIKLLKFPDEITVSKARNIGLKESSGEYVYFIDSDDYVYKNALKKLVETAKKTHADFINGEKISTPFIYDRFDEEFKKKNRTPLQKNNLSDNEFSIKLLVSPKTNSQEVLSVLHALIKKDKLNDFEFDENKRYNSDYALFSEVFSNFDSLIGVGDAIYAKRARDDPVSLTSLNQESKNDDFLRYIEEYKNVYNSLDNINSINANLLKSEMTASYLKYYYNNFASKFVGSPNKKWRNQYLKAMQDVSKNFDTENSAFSVKQEVSALQNNKLRKLKLLIMGRLRSKKLKKTFSSTSNLKLTLYRKRFNKKPINKNKIVFISFNGKYYADSPKYIYEYLYDNFKDEFEFVWVINDRNIKIKGNPKIVERFSFDYYKEVATAKYWITNGRHALRLKKRKEQVLISTWHGTPLKKLGLDIDNAYAKDPNTKKLYMRVAKQWDYLISPSQFVTDTLRSAFNYTGEVLQLGYPRNDILYNASQEKINQIKKDLDLPDNKKIILYAPTWRDDEFYETGGVEFKLRLELDKLKESLSDEYILLIKTHYFIADKLNLSDDNFAYDVSKYSDIAELYLISDILITDYSSVFFDFANLKRPILFYTYDLDRYENVLRGFYIDIRNDVPGPLLFTTDEIINSIVNIDSVNEKFEERYDKFYNTFCYIDDGNSSKRIVQEIWGK